MKLSNNTFFIGHGSPMNIVADNVFTQSMLQISEALEKPKAILAVSAHWITEGAQMTVAAKPKQIYDFGGFPETLYNVKYQPRGAPELVKEFTSQHAGFHGTEEWGLDHGTWSVLHHMYPKQDIPVFQLSLNRQFNVDQHLQLARELKSLREKNILILGSGNIVHNLRQIEWDADAPAKAWALEYETTVIEALKNSNYSTEERLEKIFGSQLLRQAHPSLEHLIPLIYAIGASDEKAETEVLINGIQNSSISMASLKF